MIKSVIFDLGGVIFAQSFENAVSRFREIGIQDTSSILDPHAQVGIFGELESGRMDAETFRRKLGELAGRELTVQDCKYACTGFVDHLPQRNLDALRKLRGKDIRLILLSNTNPFMMMWAMSTDFDGQGHSLREYMDECYLSYECHLMKPDVAIFKYVIEKERINPSETIFVDDSKKNVLSAQSVGLKTLCPEANKDWTQELFKLTGLA